MLVSDDSLVPETASNKAQRFAEYARKRFLLKVGTTNPFQNFKQTAENNHATQDEIRAAGDVQPTSKQLHGALTQSK